MDCRDDGCSTAAVMFGVPGIAVLAAAEVGGELQLLVETTDRVGGCRSCGVVAVAHQRRKHLLRDAPFGCPTKEPIRVRRRRPPRPLDTNLD